MLSSANYGMRKKWIITSVLVSKIKQITFHTYSNSCVPQFSHFTTKPYFISNTYFLNLGSLLNIKRFICQFIFSFRNNFGYPNGHQRHGSPFSEAMGPFSLNTNYISRLSQFSLLYVGHPGKQHSLFKSPKCTYLNFTLIYH